MCSPIAFEEGTTAPDIILFPYNNEPETGSRMPSISTGGAAIKASMKHVEAASKHGIISTPNQPTYRRLLVLVTQLQNFSQLVVVSLCRRLQPFVISLICMLSHSSSTLLRKNWMTLYFSTIGRSASRRTLYLACIKS